MNLEPKPVLQTLRAKYAVVSQPRIAGAVLRKYPPSWVMCYGLTFHPDLAEAHTIVMFIRLNTDDLQVSPPMRFITSSMARMEAVYPGTHPTYVPYVLQS